MELRALPPDESRLRLANQDFYDRLWKRARIVEAPRFNTWPLVRELIRAAPRRLEVAPGLYPRLPLAQTDFVDLSRSAAAALQQRAARVVRASVSALPYPEASFDLVCALDIVEHVAADHTAFGELARVVRPGGKVLLSLPLHTARWTVFDDLVGHFRRYDAATLPAILQVHGLSIERSAAYGMQPRSQRLAALAAWFLKHQPQRALWWYHHVGMPLALRLQSPLELHAGMIDTAGVDEVLLLCRRS